MWNNFSSICIDLLNIENQSKISISLNVLWILFLEGIKLISRGQFYEAFYSEGGVYKLPNTPILPSVKKLILYYNSF